MIAVAAVAVMSGKSGAGSHHLLPFVPVLISEAVAGVANSKDRQRIRAALFCFVFGLLPSVIASTKWLVSWHSPKTTLTFTQVSTEMRELRADLERRVGDVDVCVGFSGPSSYAATFLRPELVYAGEPYVMDPAAIMDHRLSGIALPAESVELFLTIPGWLLPRDDAPFSLNSFYGGSEPLLGAEWRRVFQEHYVRVRREKYLDLWVLR